MKHRPSEPRSGRWPKEKLEAYNQERLGDLIDAGWDLIICDEAHRLGGSTERYDTALEMQCYSGIAPVKERSGNSEWIWRGQKKCERRRP